MTGHRVATVAGFVLAVGFLLMHLAFPVGAASSAAAEMSSVAGAAGASNAQRLMEVSGDNGAPDAPNPASVHDPVSPDVSPRSSNLLVTEAAWDVPHPAAVAPEPPVLAPAARLSSFLALPDPLALIGPAHLCVFRC